MFTLTVNLDPVPGAFHTMEDALTHIQQILNDRIEHYHPVLRTIDGRRAEQRHIATLASPVKEWMVLEVLPPSLSDDHPSMERADPSAGYEFVLRNWTDDDDRKPIGLDTILEPEEYDDYGLDYDVGCTNWYDSDM